MHRFVLSAFFILNMAGVFSAALGEEQTKPAPYPEKESEWPGKGPIRKFGWMVDNRNYFWTQRSKDQGAIVFCGDSLTGNWKDIGKDFPKLEVANRGIGGDTSQAACRCTSYKEDVLDLNPKVVVMLIGTNDLTALGKPADAVSNVSDMLAMIEKQNAALPVVLCTTPPSDNPKAPVKPDQRTGLNEQLKQVAASHKNVTLLDLYATFANEDGSIKAEFFDKDRLHFARPAYEKWAELLMPILEKK